MRQDDAVKAEGTTEQPEPAPVTEPSPQPKATKKVSKAQRQKKLAVKPSGKTDFDGAKTVEELVEKHNEMVLTGVDLGLACRAVKSFVDAKTGVLACERLHAQIEKARATPAAESGSSKESTMAKKSKSTNARRSVKGKTKAAKTAKTTRTRSSFAPDARIVAMKGAENPAREGSGRHKRIAAVLAASGKSVGDFLKKGKTGTLSFCVRNKLVRVEGGGKAA